MEASVFEGVSQQVCVCALVQGVDEMPVYE